MMHRPAQIGALGALFAAGCGLIVTDGLSDPNGQLTGLPRAFPFDEKVLLDASEFVAPVWTNQADGLGYAYGGISLDDEWCFDLSDVRMVTDATYSDLEFR